MSKILVLARKDINAYFHSWLGIITFIFFFLLTGIFFCLLVTNYLRVCVEAAQNGYATVQGVRLSHFIFGSFYLNLAMVFMALVPLMTMRTFSEERRQQTLEFLFTYPLSDFEIVAGKFLALLWFFFLLAVPTLLFPALLHFFGAQLDWGLIGASYLGLFLLGIAFLSLGLFVSTLTEHQVVSALVTFSLLILLWSTEWIAGLTDGIWTKGIQLLSPLNHYREFTYGILDLSHAVYFLLFTIYFFFLALRSIETRNWKG